MPPPRYLKPVPVPVTKETPMSIFSAFDKDAKSIASKIAATMEKLFQEEPKVEAAAVSTISAVAPFVVAIAAATGNEPEAAAITAIVSVVKSDLAAVQVTLNAAGAGTTNVSAKSLLVAINANLAQLLTAGMIKNPASIATVTKDVQSISASLDVLIAAL
jgi:hypothetical protein